MFKAKAKAEIWFQGGQNYCLKDLRSLLLVSTAEQLKRSTMGRSLTNCAAESPLSVRQA